MFKIDFIWNIRATTKDKRQKTKDKRQKTKDKRQRTKDKEPRTKTKDKGPRAKNQDKIHSRFIGCKLICQMNLFVVYIYSIT